VPASPARAVTSIADPRTRASSNRTEGGC
jgi:hypothetical protein